VLELLAAQASCSLGKQRALHLKPSADEEWIGRRLQETTEARILLGEIGPPPFGGVTDISDVLQQARAGRTLEPEGLLAVAAVLRASRRLHSYYEDGAEDGPLLYELGQRLGQYPELEKAVDACIDEQAEVKPDASRELVRLTDRAQSLQAKMRERMDALLTQYAERGVLQDRLIVQREGRWCLPVQANQQSRFRGIVPGSADSAEGGALVPASAGQPAIALPRDCPRPLR